MLKLKRNLLLTHRFRTHLQKVMGLQSFHRYLQQSNSYIECMAKVAMYREQGQILDMESFKYLRRENSALRMCLILLESTLGVDLPDIVFEDETFLRMYWAAVDMVCWVNMSASELPSFTSLLLVIFVQKRQALSVYGLFDLQDMYSYRMELAKGLAGCNILTVLMTTKDIDLQAASDYVGNYYSKLMNEYVTAKEELRSKSFGSKKLDASTLR